MWLQIISVAGNRYSSHDAFHFLSSKSWEKWNIRNIIKGKMNIRRNKTWTQFPKIALEHSIKADMVYTELKTKQEWK